VTSPAASSNDLLSRPGPIPRVALVCDYLEEGWPSMDLFGDMLQQRFSEEHAAAIKVEQLRPRWRAAFAAGPLAGRSGLLRNADRLLNRFRHYPRWLNGQAGRFDLFHIVDHSYAQLALALPAGRSVVTCHDLDAFRCLLEPSFDPRPFWFQAMARRTLKGLVAAAHVISVSVATRDNLLRYGLVAPERITVIPPGVDPAYFSMDEAVKAAGRSEEPYLLHVGSTIPRKRIDLLLRIFAEVAKVFPRMRLMRVGGAFNPQQAQLAASLDLEAKIVHRPRLSKPELAAAYRDAAILLQTSDAEGFGLPVIESMATGCPVVASDIAALREAGGAPAEFCPVGEVTVWAQTVVDLLREREQAPHRWEARRAAARRHAQGFTWSKCASNTLALYQRVLENRPAEPPKAGLISADR
jgi:glycosyltransferase involved in cell wall biosynthesis